MRKILDLPEDLVRDILSRVPLTSLSAVRSTCKTWNAFSKDQILGITTKHEYLKFMIFNYWVYSLRFDLRGIYKKEDEFMKQVNMLDQIVISQVFQCNGLLLCVTKEEIIRLVVWNPYLGQTRWIQPRTILHSSDGYVFGYDNKNNHKILRFGYVDGKGYRADHIDVYDFSSGSWEVLDAKLEWDGLFCRRGMSLKGNTYFRSVSLKGNTYFFGRKLIAKYLDEFEFEVRKYENYLLCFDFEKKIFGPQLPLPCNAPSTSSCTRTLASVKDEKLAVLYQGSSLQMEIWITTKIEPNAISWSNFLKVDRTLFDGLPDNFLIYFDIESFFVDEEKRLAVLFELNRHEVGDSTRRSPTAYIIGENRYLKSVNMGVLEGISRWEFGVLSLSHLLMCQV